MADDKKGEDSQLDKAQLFGVWLAQMVQGVQLTVPYTIAVYMVRSYLINAGESPDEARIGRLTGVLASLFPAAQFLTSYFWGYLSDFLGRKPVVLIGNVFCAVTIVLFGWSRSFALAAAARVIGGLLNGVQGALRTMIGEAYSVHHQAIANGYLSFAWGTGTIVGPAIAGMLSEPCTHLGDVIPLCHPGQLFQQRPYFLPCAIVGVIQLVAALVNCLMMTETLNQNRRKKAPDTKYGSFSSPPLSWTSAASHAARISSTQSRTGAVAVPTDGNGELVQPLLSNGSTYSVFTDCETTPFATQTDPTDENEEAQPLTDGSGDPVYPMSARPSVFSALSDQSIISCYMDLETGQLTPAFSGTYSSDLTPWYRLPRVYMALLGASMVSFLFNIIEEVVPLFAASPPAFGGLGWNSKQLAPNLIFGGVVLIIFSLMIYPRLQRMLGVTWSAIMGCILLIPSILVIPVSSLKSSSIWQHTMMFIAYGIKSISGPFAFTGSTILLNFAAPLSQLAAVNGIGQSLSAGVRALGPAAGGYVWALSVGWNLPGHQFIVFGGTAICSALTAVVFYNTRVPALGH